ncbi:hypothetical protein IC229_13420 [Spirosoma sp. BT702]|uniref:Uncharacterized protein n=1 Tax=Spirosoma profusum TaxID=2771354 RepID=A0A926Y394_9BACT|nr:hypothetical protein [Spirosoma profusum]MBD2701645.1 hypothetical protein [Spirosoma profusum]
MWHKIVVILNKCLIALLDLFFDVCMGLSIGAEELLKGFEQLVKCYA